VNELPASIHDFQHCKPIYKLFKGWNTDISKIKKYEKLPLEARKYMEYISKSLNVPISILSVGPSRGEEIFL